MSQVENIIPTELDNSFTPEELQKILSIHDNINEILYIIEYYRKTNNEIKMLKLLKVAVEPPFSNPESIREIIFYYIQKREKEECIKYWGYIKHEKQKYYMLGFINECFGQVEEMKISYYKFLELSSLEDLSDLQSNYSITYVIHIFIQNEIDLPHIQTIINKFKIRENNISGQLQFKLNKINLPNYKKHDECPICYNKTELQMYDCLGHHFCVNCTININECAICKCACKPVFGKDSKYLY
jgi:hypothetical protein